MNRQEKIFEMTLTTKNIIFNIPKGFEMDQNKSTKDKIVLKCTEKNFVDLGLPSGNLWASENEDGYYTYDEAVGQFGENLPTIVDFAELVHYCKWEWSKTEKGMIVTGPNGNCIVLGARGYRDKVIGSELNVNSYGCYWSASPNPGNSNYAYNLYFSLCSVTPANSSFRSYGYSVRCVKRVE